MVTRNLTILPALLLVLLWAGCEEDVVLVSGTDHVYSLYGVLNPTADTQFVYVFPVEPSLEPGRPEPLDARVTSVERETGETVVWTDSLVQDAQGHFAHVYWRAGRVAYEHTYRLAVERSDGAESSAEVTVPPRVRVATRDASLGSQVWHPVDLVGAAPQLLRVEVVYWAHAIEGFAAGGTPILTDRMISAPLEGRLSRTAEGWRVMLNLTEAYAQAYAAFAKDLTPALLNNGIQLSLITLRAIVANEAWSPPDGIFDPEVLIVPEVMTNVDEGFGFVGAGYRVQHQWRPPIEAAAAAGFRPIA